MRGEFSGEAHQLPKLIHCIILTSFFSFHSKICSASENTNIRIFWFMILIITHCMSVIISTETSRMKRETWYYILIAISFVGALQLGECKSNALRLNPHMNFQRFIFYLKIQSPHPRCFSSHSKLFFRHNTKNPLRVFILRCCDDDDDDDGMVIKKPGKSASR